MRLFLQPKTQPGIHLMWYFELNFELSKYVKFTLWIMLNFVKFGPWIITNFQWNQSILFEQLKSAFQWKILSSMELDGRETLLVKKLLDSSAILPDILRIQELPISSFILQFGLLLEVYRHRTDFLDERRYSTIGLTL